MVKCVICCQFQNSHLRCDCYVYVVDQNVKVSSSMLTLISHKLTHKPNRKFLREEAQGLHTVASIICHQTDVHDRKILIFKDIHLTK